MSAGTNKNEQGESGVKNRQFERTYFLNSRFTYLILDHVSGVDAIKANT